MDAISASARCGSELRRGERGLGYRSELGSHFADLGGVADEYDVHVLGRRERLLDDRMDRGRVDLEQIGAELPDVAFRQSIEIQVTQGDRPICGRLEGQRDTGPAGNCALSQWPRHPGRRA